MIKMKTFVYHMVLLLFFVFKLKTSTCDSSSNEDSYENSTETNCGCNSTVVICYFTNWAVYRSGNGSYGPDDIDPTLCTHVIYAFASLDNDTLTIKMSDSYADEDLGFYNKVTALVKKGIKVLLSIGGWNDSEGDKYSRLVNNCTARANFVNHTVEYLQTYRFCGLDLDWEYPKCWQGDCSLGPESDKENFGNLLKELSEAFKPHSLSLSVAVAAGKKYLNTSYDVPVLVKHVDHIGVMTYDIHTAADGYTGANSPLYGDGGMIQSLLNWEAAGAPRCKLVAGFPFYGHTFTLKDPENHDIGAPTTGPGNAGKYTQTAGTISYYELCSDVISQNWTSVCSTEYGSYYYLDDQWTSCLDAYDIIQRASYLKKNGYLGAMLWALDFDDFKNVCGFGVNPLLTALNYIRT